MATIIDVAKLAGVSKTTVSKILGGKGTVREKTRLKIEEAMKKLDYTPNYFAQGMRTNKTNMIAVLIPDFSNSGYIEMLKGIEEAALEKGYMLIICNTGIEGQEELNYIRELIKRQIDGIVYFTYRGKRENIDFLIRISKDIPVVFMDHILEDEETVSYVMVDGFEGTREAVRYLVGKGRRSIGYIRGPLKNISTNERFLGYKQALADFNINFDSQLVYEGDFTFKSGFEGAKKLMNLKTPPEAIVSATDIMAIGALKYLKYAGVSIPEAVNVIGFDDIPLCTLFDPPLTTVSQSQKVIGKLAAEVLLERIKNPDTPNKKILLKGELIIRRSTDETKDSIEIF